MKLLNAFIGGLAGAASVTLLHEAIRHCYKGAPRLDKLGMEATEKAIEVTGHDAPAGDNLYVTSMVGDLLTNALYYGVIATRPKQLMKTGTLIGLSAGLGAVTLPESIGLDPDHSAGTKQRKAITVGLYTLGGIIAAAVIKRLEKV